MPALPNFDAMTLEEIEEWNIQQNAKIQTLRAEYRLSNPARAKRIAEQDLAEAVKWLTVAADASGRTMEAQAWYWLVDEMAADIGPRVPASPLPPSPPKHKHGE